MQRRWKKLSGLVAIALLFTSCGHKKDITPYSDIPKSSMVLLTKYIENFHASEVEEGEKSKIQLVKAQS